MGAQQDLENVPGVDAQPDSATKDFIFQQARRCSQAAYTGLVIESGSGTFAMTVYVSVQTMYRIKDPKRSLDFYTRVIGMRYVSSYMQVNRLIKTLPWHSHMMMPRSPLLVYGIFAALSPKLDDGSAG